MRGLALVIALALALIGCQAKESEAVAVARTFAETARRGDVAGMLTVVERPAIERLQAAAETASDQVGGRRAIEPREMLQIVGVDRTVAVASAKLLDEDGERAHVELTMTDGRSVRLELVWEAGDDQGQAGAWKVRIPLPSAGHRSSTGAHTPDA
jgi:hypothetical protein